MLRKIAFSLLTFLPIFISLIFLSFPSFASVSPPPQLGTAIIKYKYDVQHYSYIGIEQSQYGQHGISPEFGYFCSGQSYAQARNAWDSNGGSYTLSVPFLRCVIRYNVAVQTITTTLTVPSVRQSQTFSMIAEPLNNIYGVPTPAFGDCVLKSDNSSLLRRSLASLREGIWQNSSYPVILSCSVESVEWLPGEFDDSSSNPLVCVKDSFLSKFPFDIFTAPLPDGTPICPSLTLFGNTMEFCFIKDLFIMLEVPALIWIIIQVLINL